jgi:predicted RNA binding protein YcfA (HicA-like mRNA interferase family)
MPKVRDAIRLIERSGWELTKDPGRSSAVPSSVASGAHDDRRPAKHDLPRGTWASILRQAGLKGDER